MTVAREGILRAAFAGFVAAAAIRLCGYAPLQNRPTATPQAAGSVGILSGYHLFSVPAYGAARKSGAIDLRLTLGEEVVRKSQDHGEPEVKMLSASNDGSLLLINLSGRPVGNDGPVIAVDSRTGKPAGTFAIADPDAVAAFLPGDPRSFVAYWHDYITPTGSTILSVFALASGARTLTLPGREPPAGTFLFLNPSTLIVRDPAARQYRLVDTTSWKDLGVLAPTGTENFSILDAREGKVLIEQLDRARTVSLWSVGEAASTKAIDQEPSAGAELSSYVLAGRGDRVVKWRRDGGVAVYDSSGRLISRQTAGKRILQCAVNPDGGSVAFAADEGIVILEVARGSVVSRLSKALPEPGDAGPYLFWRTGGN
jgi:hypothetical protein